MNDCPASSARARAAEPPVSKRRRRSSGFTLIEAVVALAVVAMSIAAIGNLTNATLRSRVFVARHLAQVETTQQILAGLPGRDGVASGPLSGERESYAWALGVAPFRAEFASAGGASSWVPAQLTLTVQGPSGARLSVDTVRLVRPRPR